MLPAIVLKASPIPWALASVGASFAFSVGVITALSSLRSKLVETLFLAALGTTLSLTVVTNPGIIALRPAAASILIFGFVLSAFGAALGDAVLASTRLVVFFPLLFGEELAAISSLTDAALFVVIALHAYTSRQFLAPAC